MNQIRTQLMERLEDRILFDAVPDAPAVSPDAEGETQQQPEVGQALTEQEEQEQESTRWIVVLDPTVNLSAEQLDQLLANYTSSGFEVRLLNELESGIDQVGDLLEELNSGDSDAPDSSVFLLTQGGQTGFQLGGDWIDGETLTLRGDEIAAWGNQLSADDQLKLLTADQVLTSEMPGEDLTDLLDSLSRLVGQELMLDGSSQTTAEPTITEETSLAEYSEIVFVDTSVSQYEQLLAEVTGQHQAEIVLLDADRDGVQQIADALAGRTDVRAIHIISHGTEGRLFLGNTVLDAESMQNQHLEALLAIGSALHEDGDILIYGCDFTEGEEGLQAAMILGGITGADIAASSDATGYEGWGGDWVLETQLGSIDTQTLAAASWQGLLMPPVATNNSYSDSKNSVITGNVITDDTGEGVDSDPASNPLQLVSFTVDGTTYQAGQTAELAEGTLRIDSSGEFIFTPASIYAVTVPTVTYTIGTVQDVGINGSMEGLDASHSRQTFNSQLPPGWTYVNGTPDTFDDTNTLGDMAWVASPDGGDFIHAIATSVQEIFETALSGLIVGESYTVSFYQTSASYSGGSNDGHWSVDVAGITYRSDTMTGPSSNTAAPWESQSFTFTATDTTETLRFTPVLESGSRVDLAVDGVSIASGPTARPIWTLNCSITSPR